MTAAPPRSIDLQRCILHRQAGLPPIVWSLPVTMMFAGAIWIPLAPVVLVMFACWLLRRLAQSDGREAQSLPGKAAPAAA